ncbi:MAG: hypothetical protein MHPSP_002221, partial [Paramarteilia canceri]
SNTSIDRQIQIDNIDDDYLRTEAFYIDLEVLETKRKNLYCMDRNYDNVSLKYLKETEIDDLIISDLNQEPWYKSDPIKHPEYFKKDEGLDDYYNYSFYNLKISTYLALENDNSIHLNGKLNLDSQIDAFFTVSNLALINDFDVNVIPDKRFLIQRSFDAKDLFNQFNGSNGLDDEKNKTTTGFNEKPKPILYEKICGEEKPNANKFFDLKEVSKIRAIFNKIFVRLYGIADDSNLLELYTNITNSVLSIDEELEFRTKINKSTNEIKNILNSGIFTWLTQNKIDSLMLNLKSTDFISTIKALYTKLNGYIVKFQIIENINSSLELIKNKINSSEQIVKIRPLKNKLTLILDIIIDDFSTEKVLKDLFDNLDVTEDFSNNIFNLFEKIFNNTNLDEVLNEITEKIKKKKFRKHVGMIIDEINRILESSTLYIEFKRFFDSAIGIQRFEKSQCFLLVLSLLETDFQNDELNNLISSEIKKAVDDIKIQWKDELPEFAEEIIKAIDESEIFSKVSHGHEIIMRLKLKINIIIGCTAGIGVVVIITAISIYFCIK